MKAKSIPSTWLDKDGRRLDCGPYMSGALEAREAIAAFPGGCEALVELLDGREAGLQKPPRISPQYVQRDGVPYLSSSDILRFDLGHLPQVSKRQASKLDRYTIRAGATLVTSSGDVGRTAYAREEMSGMLGSPHFIRVVPDRSRVPPGYLYAYLSGRYGRALMREGTYGSIIVAIETHQLRGLPVPRLGPEREGYVHRLVERASSLRTAAARALREAGHAFDLLAQVVADTSPKLNSVEALRLQARMDARYFDRAVESAQAELRKGSTTTIGEFCSTIFLPGIFKRLHVEDPKHGVPYYTGAALFALEPEPKGYLSPRTSKFEDVLLTRDTILVQAFGQEGGLTGRAVWVGEHLEGSATTHMLVRLRCNDRHDTAYLFGFLQSELAYAQLARLPYGGSIPHFDEHGVSSVVVPLLPSQARNAMSERVLAATSQLEEAVSLEREARLLVEEAVDRGVERWPQ